jgi:hypothetical protein
VSLPPSQLPRVYIRENPPPSPLGINISRRHLGKNIKRRREKGEKFKITRKERESKSENGK